MRKTWKEPMEEGSWRGQRCSAFREVTRSWFIRFDEGMTQNEKIKSRTCFSAAPTPRTSQPHRRRKKKSDDPSQSSPLCRVPVGSGGISYQGFSTRIPPISFWWERLRVLLKAEVMWVWISRRRTRFSSPTKGEQKETRGKHLDRTAEGKKLNQANNGQLVCFLFSCSIIHL